MLRRVLSLTLPVSLIALLTACGNDQEVEAPPRPAMVVQPEPAAALLETFPGEVRARFEPELAFRIGGKVSKRLVEVGERVKADQPLAELDPQDVRLQLEAVRAQMAAAEANLNLARAERDRYQTLLERQLVSRSHFDSADNAYRSAEAQYQQVRAQYDVARNQATYAVLRAPQNGVIASRRLEVGQVVAAGQTVLTLAADGEREVAIGLPEHALERFRLGQEVAVELWSQPGKRFPARIRELAPAADPNSRTFAARVAFLEGGNVPAELGQSARVLISHAGSVPLAVPLSALSAEGGKPFVWVVDPGTETLQRRLVQVGPYGESRVPVLAGLDAKDWVVAAGVQVLREGQKVRPVDRNNRPVTLTRAE